MKHKFLLILIAGTIAISGMSSCKKDVQLPPGGGGSNNIQPIEYTLTASNWVLETDGFYSDNFKNLISAATTAGRSVKVYLLDNGKQIQINQFIFFMDGELWASSTATDVKITYRNSDNKLPFDKLNIKIVIE